MNPIFDENDAWNESPQLALQRAFELPATDNMAWNEMKLLLEQELHSLLKKQPEKLKHILYRIDVNEKLAAAAMASEHPAQQLAALIIERQIQKVKSRNENS